MGLVKFFVRAGRIGLTFYGSGHDWSNFLCKSIGLIRHFVGVDRIG